MAEELESVILVGCVDQGVEVIINFRFSYVLGVQFRFSYVLKFQRDMGQKLYS